MLLLPTASLARDYVFDIPSDHASGGAANYFGPLHFSMAECSPDNRVVRIDTNAVDQMGIFMSGPPTNQIDDAFRQAIQYAQQVCPSDYSRPSDTWGRIDQGSIYLADGTEFARGYAYSAGHFSQMVFVHQQLLDEEYDAENAHRWHVVWVWVQWLLAAAALIWVVINFAAIWRFVEAIWRFVEKALVFLYGLTPHPASALVDHAMATGEPLDEEAFVESMRPIPGNRFEQAARKKQAVELAERARQNAAELLAEAEQMKRRALSEAAFIEAQDALVHATIEQQKAQARLDALAEKLGAR